MGARCGKVSGGRFLVAARARAAAEGGPCGNLTRPAGPGTGTVFVAALLGGEYGRFTRRVEPVGRGPFPRNLGDRVNGRCGRVREPEGFMRRLEES